MRLFSCSFALPVIITAEKRIARRRCYRYATRRIRYGDAPMTILFEGMLLGLSLGVTCIATCAPVYAPILMQRERGALPAIGAVLLMSTGRFLSYAAVGLAVGAAGSAAAESFPLGTVTAVSYLLIATFLVYTALVHGHTEKHGGCPTGLIAKTAGNPFLAGLVTGFSVCPPFLGALARGFDAGGAIGGMLLFIGFFAGTTAYFLPMTILPLVARHRIVRILGIFFSLVAALWFTLLAFDHFFDLRFRAEIYLEDAYLVDYARDPIILLDTGEEEKGRSLAVRFPSATYRHLEEASLRAALESFPPHSNLVLLITAPPENALKDIVVSQRLNVVWTFAPENAEEIAAIGDFLSSYVLKARKKRGFLYQLPIATAEMPDS